MAEYISREELRKHLKECYDNELFDADMRKATIGIDVYVENMPAADVQPARFARWIDLDNRILCSGCGAGYDDSDEVKQNIYIFCPNCGARMDGDVE